MKEMLKEKLWAYIVNNNPDLMISLQEEQSVDNYLDNKVAAVMPTAEQLLAEGKPHYIISEICMNEMIADLKPSRYQYICSVLEDEFPNDYERLKEDGTLTYEVISMIKACNDIFDEFEFSIDNEDNRFLKYAIIGRVHDYLL